jgi:hypothetical protein
MHGPIDYIIVGFKGSKFDGKILKAVGEAIDSGAIGLVGLSAVAKDKDGIVRELDIADTGDNMSMNFFERFPAQEDTITKDDLEEIGDLLEPDTAAGYLVIEQLWAKPLKSAIAQADGVLIAEGRIHPEAAAELNEEGEE